MKTKDQIQEEALAALSKVRGGTAAMSVGTGKTLVGLKHMDLHYTDTSFFLVVAPKKSIFQSWIDDAKKFGFDYLLDRITFTTYLSLPKQQLHYDAVYLDEAHSLLESHAGWLNAYKGIKIGLTGTPPKFQHSLRGRLFNAHIPVVYNYITDDAVEDKILNDYHIIVHKLKLNKAKILKAGKPPKTWMTSEQDSYNYWTNRINNAVGIKERQIMSILRMKALMDFPTKEKYAKKLMDMMMYKTIIFANTQQQAEKFGVPTYHSKNLD
ncbi:MAG TPA: DEAD/DEAH box helicase family protein, partial [Candidatus Dojkabacteria bacterium]|nr:DEAD/DEAH box helicase family protein [Candidatus Dojkabacteria bacterium]